MPAPASDDVRQSEALAGELARLRRRVDQLDADVKSTRLAASSIDGKSIPIYDNDGRLASRIGKLPDGSIVGGAPVELQAPPETPKPPTVVAGIGTLKVESHGSTDPPWPSNYSHLNVWLSIDEHLAPSRLVGIIPGRADGALVISGLAYQPYRVWFTSVNISGAESARSAQVTAQPNQVVGGDVLDGIITEVHLADEAVTAAKIAVEAVQNYHFGDQVVDLRALADDSVGSDQLIAAAILARHIGAGQVTAAAIVAEAIQAIHIAAESVQAEHMAADSVTARAIAALAVQADHLDANSVTAGAIQAGAVLAEHIRAGEILADISVTTGDGTGRRIVMDGPNNEMRFYPRRSNLNYGRLYSYTPDDLTEDVTVELRSINSSQTNALPRLLMQPDQIALVVVDSADTSLARGGYLQLTEDAAIVGTGTPAGTTAGLSVFSDGELQVEGFFKNGRPPRATDGVWALSVLLTNSGAATLMAVNVTYGTTMEGFMAPFLSAGIVGAAAKKRQWSLRDENNGATGFILRLGLSEPTSTGDVGEAGGLPAGESIRLRILGLRMDLPFGG